MGKVHQYSLTLRLLLDYQLVPITTKKNIIWSGLVFHLWDIVPGAAGFVPRKARRFQWGQCIQRYQILLERSPLKLGSALAYSKNNLRKRRIGEYFYQERTLFAEFHFFDRSNRLKAKRRQSSWLSKDKEYCHGIALLMLFANSTTVIFNYDLTPAGKVTS